MSTLPITAVGNLASGFERLNTLRKDTAEATDQEGKEKHKKTVADAPQPDEGKVVLPQQPDSPPVVGRAQAKVLLKSLEVGIKSLDSAKAVEMQPVSERSLIPTAYV